MRRRASYLFWKVVNPLVIHFAGFAPWWLILETTGRRTGQARRVPLARGPMEGDTFWLISAHGRKALWVRNLEATPRARVKHRGRWRDVAAAIEPMDEQMRRRFNLYARAGTGMTAIEPCLVALRPA